MQEIFMDDGRVSFEYDDENYSMFHYVDSNRPRRSREGSYSFSQISGVEILKNNQSVTSGGHGIVGGLLFGAPGAIIGSSMGRKTEEVVSEIILRIHLMNAEIAFVDIFAYRKEGHFMYGKVMADSEQQCMRIYNTIQSYLANKNNNPPVKDTDVAEKRTISENEDMMNLLALYDNGQISDAEFGRRIAAVLHYIKTKNEWN